MYEAIVNILIICLSFKQVNALSSLGNSTLDETIIISEKDLSFPNCYRDEVFLSYCHCLGVYCSDERITRIIVKRDELFAALLMKDLCEMKYLMYLDMSFNKIQGTIPSCLSLLKNLVYADFQGNHLTGTIPRELDNMSSLKMLHLNDNGLRRVPEPRHS